MATLAEVYDVFHNDLAEFLKADSMNTPTADADFESMREKYPARMHEGRIEFFPGHDEGRYLVSPPGGMEDHYLSLSADSEFSRDIAEYLSLEERGKGLEALEKMADMKADYDHVWDEDTMVFFPPKSDETRVAIPGLESLARAYNGRLGEEDLAEREFLEEFIEAHYRYEGTLSKTVYISDDAVVFLDEDADLPEGEIPMQVADSLYEALPMMEIIEGVKWLSEYDEFDPFPDDYEADTWDSTTTDVGSLQRLLWEYYYTGDVLLDEGPSDVYEVYHDPVDSMVVLWGSDASGDSNRIISDEEVLMDMEAMDGGYLFNDVMESRPLFDPLL